MDSTIKAARIRFFISKLPFCICGPAPKVGLTRFYHIYSKIATSIFMVIALQQGKLAAAVRSPTHFIVKIPAFLHVF